MPICWAVSLCLGFDIAWREEKARADVNDVNAVPSLSEPHGPDRAMALGGRLRAPVSQSCSAGRLGPATTRRGLASTEILLGMDDPALGEVVAAVRKADGSTIGAYREPLSGRPLLLASLPFSAIEPTPFQRDLSPTHAKRLAAAIEATGAFLDPLIVVLLAFVPTYFFGLLLAISTIDAAAPTDFRLLSPLFIPAVALTSFAAAR